MIATPGALCTSGFFTKISTCIQIASETEAIALQAPSSSHNWVQQLLLQSTFFALLYGYTDHDP